MAASFVYTYTRTSTLVEFFFFFFSQFTLAPEPPEGSRVQGLRFGFSDLGVKIQGLGSFCTCILARHAEAREREWRRNLGGWGSG